MAQETIEQLQKELKLMKEAQAGFQIDISNSLVESIIRKTYLRIRKNLALKRQ